MAASLSFLGAVTGVCHFLYPFAGGTGRRLFHRLLRKLRDRIQIIKMGVVDLVGDVSNETFNLIYKGGRAVKNHYMGRAEADIFLSARVLFRDPVC